MLKIYGSNISSPACKIRICANAIGLAYDYIEVDLGKGEQKQPSYVNDIHPAGKVPAIDDNGFHLFESNAIIKYLCKTREADLYPEDLIQQTLVDQWCDFISLHIGTAYSRVVFNKLISPKYKLPIDNESVKTGYGFIETYLPVVETQLCKHPYIAGNAMTIADISLLATIDASELIDVDIHSHPKLDAWRENLKARDFYREVHEQYMEALQS